jgi:hypothetical protein
VSGPYDVLEAALALARDGFDVVPLWSTIDGRCGCGDTRCKSPGKHPIGALAPKGWKNASSGPETIREWWRINPGANLGLRVGLYVGRGWLVVVDIDRHAGRPDGVAAYRDLLVRHGQVDLLQTTLGATSATGFHAYFWSGVEVRTIELAPGVELRATGYVVMPPSLAATGKRYERVGANEIEDLPDWVHSVVDAESRKSVPARTRGVAPKRSDRDWGGCAGVLSDWDRRDEVKDAVSRLVGVSSDRFVPFHRPSISKSAACEWWLDRDGYHVVRDHGAFRHNSLPSLTCTEFYAAWKTGITKRLRGDQATWKVRMLIEIKFLEPYPLELDELPDGLSPIAQAFYKALAEVTVCRWTLESFAPILCSVEFAQHWAQERGRRGPLTGRSVGALTNARNEIEAAGLFHRTAMLKYRGARHASPLLLPGPRSPEGPTA